MKKKKKTKQPGDKITGFYWWVLGGGKVGSPKKHGPNPHKWALGPQWGGMDNANRRG